MSKNTNLSFLTDYITADITNGRIGINNASPTVAFDVTGVSKFTGAALFSNTETTFNFNTQTSLLAGYNYLNFGGGSIMYRNNTDIYIGSNAKYGASGTVVAGYTSAAGMGLVAIDGGAFYYQANATSVTAGTAYAVPTRFYINGNGNVGIGTITPRTSASGTNATLDIKGGIYFGSTNAESCTINNDDSMIFNIDANNSNTTNFFRWATNTTLETGGSELMRLTEAGNLGIGNTGESIARLSITSPNASNGNYGIITRNSTTAITFYVSNIGNYYFAGVNESDRRVKNNIIQIDSALEKVKLLKPSTFSYIRNKNETRGGFIAQEVKEVFPEFVSRQENEDDIMGVDYNGILAAAVKAIQELSTEINLLKQK
jgi:hypothetical protein